MTIHYMLCVQYARIIIVYNTSIYVIWVGAFVSTGNTINSCCLRSIYFFLCSLINVYWFLSVFLLTISYCQRLYSVHDTTTLFPYCLWNAMLVILTNCIIFLIPLVSIVKKKFSIWKKILFSPLIAVFLIEIIP